MKRQLLTIAVLASILLVFVPDCPLAQQIWDNELLQTAEGRNITSEAIILDVSENPHIISSFKQDLIHSWYDGLQWQTESVSVGLESVGNASIAVGLDGTIHVIFYNAITNSEHAIYHACKSGSNWIITHLGQVKYQNPCPMRFDSNGYLNLVFINDSDVLIRARMADGLWGFSVIASDAYLYAGWSMDLDSEDDLHVCFQSGYEMIYMYSKDSEWYREILNESVTHLYIRDMTLDESDRPHILINQGSLKYLTKESNSWKELEVDPGHHDGSSIVIDNNNTVHVFTLTDLGASDARCSHFYLTGTEWEHEIIDPIDFYKGSVAAVCCQSGLMYIVASNKTMSYQVCFFGTENAWERQLIAEFGVFRDCSIAIDKQNDIHLLYLAHSGNQLQYACKRNGEWQVEILDDQMSTESGQCCIAVDDIGHVHVLYYNAIKQALYYAEKTDEEWHSEEIWTQSYPADSELAVTGDGNVFVLIGTNVNLYLLRKNEASWDIGSFKPGSYRTISLCLDSSGAVHCAYYRFNNGGFDTQYSLYYRYYSAAGWIEELVDGMNAGTGDEIVNLQVDKNGIPRIFYRKGIADEHCGTSWSTYSAERGQDGWKAGYVPKQWTNFVYRLRDHSDLHILSDSTVNFLSDDFYYITSLFCPLFRASIYSQSIAFDSTGRIHLLYASNYDIELIYTHQQLPKQGVRLEMEKHEYSNNSNYFYLNSYFRSDGVSLHHVPCCIFLEYLDEFWFWPDWEDQCTVEYVDVKASGSARLAIPQFYYRGPVSPPLEGLTFWGALLNNDMTEILGGADGIGKWEFSIQ